ncbi:MAG: hypothetical protein WCO93_10215 [bacterium]
MGNFFKWLFEHTGWLYTKICENNLFFIDYWTFPHLWSGLVVFFLLAALGWKRKFLWLFVFITLYEVVEILLEIFALHIFKPEIIKDKLTDIFTGAIGGLIAWVILRWKPKQENPNWFVRNTPALFSSGTLSFLWVGSYQYKYNIEWMNFPGLNLWAFLLWMSGGFIFLKIYLYLRRTAGRKYRGMLLAWLIYFLLLLVIEFVGYQILQIRETSIHVKQPLVFGLIHGSAGLHIYYLIFPFLIILFHETQLKVIAKARLNMSDPSGKG